jgi:group I intron endonuclease
MLVIYKAEFPNGKVYIGKTKNFEQRKYHHIWNSHREENSHIIMYKAICKYGSDNINWSILCECLDNDDMNKKEIEYIKISNGLLIKQIANKENKTIMIISRILHDSGVRISKRFSDGRMSDGSKPRKKKSIDE